MVILITAIALPFSFKIETEYALEHFFPSNSPEVDRYYDFAEEFGADDRRLVVAFEAKDMFTPHRLAMIDSLTEILAEDVYGIDEVISLTNAEIVWGEGDELIIEEIVPKIPIDQVEADQIKRRVMAESIICNKLISEDGTVTAIILQTDSHQNGFEFRERVLNELDQKLANFPGIKFYISGIAYFRNGYANMMQRDLKIFVPLGLLINLLVFLWLFRTVQGVFLPILTVLIGGVWSLACMYLMGISFNAMTHILPVLLLIVGVADSIHILSKYYQEIAKKRNTTPLPQNFSDVRRQIIYPSLKETVRSVGEATFLTSLTTAIGFATLYTANIILVREYAVISALGVMLVFAASILFLPLALNYFNPPPEQKLKVATGGMVHHFLIKIDQIAQKYPRLILIICAIILITFGYGVTQIEVNSYAYEEVGPGNPIYDNLKFVETNLSGTLPFEMTIDTGIENGFQNPETLHRIEKLQQYIESFPEIQNSISLATLIKELHQALNEENKAFYTIPDNEKAVAELIFLYELSGGEELDDVVTFDRSKGRVSSLILDCGSARTNEILEDINQYAQQLFLPSEKFIITGTIPIVVKVNHFFSIDILRGLLIAFLLISIIMAILFRSPKIVFASLIPNLIPIIIIAGLMGFAGIRLRPVTAITFSIAFGIAVDDTIHFLAKFRQATTGGADLSTAIHQTIMTTGKAMIFTSIILFIGFIVLLTSSFSGTSTFGLLTAITLIVALIADLLVLPALILVIRPQFKKS